MTTGLMCHISQVYAIIFVFQFGSTNSEGVPLTPSNLTVHTVRKHDALIRWKYPENAHKSISRFEMTIWPEYPDKEYMSVQLLQLAKIEPYLRQVTIYNLHPGTMYVAYMTAVNEEGVSNKTDNVTFTTFTESQLFHPVDTLVVFGVLCLWCIAVTAFLQRWGSIRIVQPRDTRYKFKPKNLDTIRVCKRTTDSVIYKNYSRQMSFTLEKREEKLERLNTLKQIEIETEAGLAREKEEILRQKGRVLDKEEKRHIMAMLEQKKKLKKQMKVCHRDGPAPTRPRLMPKPGVTRGQGFRRVPNRGSKFIMDDDDHKNDITELNEEEEDVDENVEETLEVNADNSVEECSEAQIDCELETVIVEPIPLDQTEKDVT